MFLDLHGNSLKKERCPDGSKDQNVFDIRQGVAIALFIKKQGEKKGCSVYHSEIWGLREKKNNWLSKDEIRTTKWQKLSPKSAFYLFIPRDERLLEKYENYLRITEVFPLNGVGMTTARDRFVIDRDRKTLENRIRLFKNSKYSDNNLHTFFQINRKKGWSIRKAWDMLQSISDYDLNKFIRPVLYRPFDVQWIFYHDSVVWRTVKRVMRHMRHDNLGLITSRQMDKSGIQPVFMTDSMIDAHSITSAVSISNLFPLYLYPDLDKKGLFSRAKEPGKRQPNISPKLFTTLAEAYKKEPSPEEIFYYIYAVLYSHIYRTKYAEFLKIDFSRIPFTENCELFDRMTKYGKRLVDLHQLKSIELDPLVAKFHGKGGNKVEKLRYDEKEKRVCINQNQHFEGIKKEIWEYQVGGYQVCNKWLKDRKEKKLSLDEIKHYCKILTSLQKTIEIQRAIDDIYREVEKRTAEFDI